MGAKSVMGISEDPTTVKVDYAARIEAWYNEVDNYPDNTAQKAVGHYTQVVWADTSRVGCGIIAQYSLNYYGENQHWLRHDLVCDYYTAGNMAGNAPYNNGDAASACPEGTFAVDGLCQESKQ